MSRHPRHYVPEFCHGVHWQVVDTDTVRLLQTALHASCQFSNINLLSDVLGEVPFDCAAKRCGMCKSPLVTCPADVQMHHSSCFCCCATQSSIYFSTIQVEEGACTLNVAVLCICMAYACSAGSAQYCSAQPNMCRYVGALEHASALHRVCQKTQNQAL